jgi:hypothetical protein
MLLKRKLNEPHDYHQHNQSIHVTDAMIVTSLSASLLQKISAATDCLCQIMLNLKSSRKIDKWCKFSSWVKAKSHKMRFTCISLYCNSFVLDLHLMIARKRADKKYIMLNFKYDL